MYHLYIYICIQYITLIASQPGTPDFTHLWSSSPQLLLSFKKFRILVIASCDPRGRGFGKLLTCVHMQMFAKSLRLVSDKKRVCKWCLDKLSTLDAFHAFFLHLTGMSEENLSLVGSSNISGNGRKLGFHKWHCAVRGNVAKSYYKTNSDNLNTVWSPQLHCLPPCLSGITPCSDCSKAFNVRAETVFGQSIKVVGSTPESRWQFCSLGFREINDKNGLPISFT